MQWNIQGYYPRLEKLQLIMNQSKPSVICLQETHFKGDLFHDQKDYKCFYKNRNPAVIASGGVAMYVNKSYQATEINLTTNLEAVAASINFRNKISICNIYIPHGRNLDITELQHLIDQLPRPRLIIGDFNCHNILWGSINTNAAGTLMENFIDSTKLMLLNTGEPTRFNAATGGFSNIDLSMCDPELFTYLEWRTYDYLYGSDHFPIKIDYLLEPGDLDISSVSSRWNLKNAHWADFSDTVEQYCSNFVSSSDPDEMLLQFNRLVLSSAEAHVKKVTLGSKKKTVPWWNSECETAIKQSKKALNKLKRHKTPENLTEFKRLRAIARFTVKQSKRTSWASYVSSINPSTPSNEIWRKIRSIKGINPGSSVTYLTQNNNVINSPQGIAELFADSFQKVSSNTNYDETFLQYKQQLQLQYNYYAQQRHKTEHTQH